MTNYNMLEHLAATTAARAEVVECEGRARTWAARLTAARAALAMIDDAHDAQRDACGEAAVICEHYL
jgi:hypothetical protein